MFVTRKRLQQEMASTTAVMVRLIYGDEPESLVAKVNEHAEKAARTAAQLNQEAVAEASIAEKTRKETIVAAETKFDADMSAAEAKAARAQVEEDQRAKLAALSAGFTKS